MWVALRVRVEGRSASSQSLLVSSNSLVSAAGSTTPTAAGPFVALSSPPSAGRDPDVLASPVTAGHGATAGAGLPSDASSDAAEHAAGVCNDVLQCGVRLSRAEFLQSFPLSLNLAPINRGCRWRRGFR